MVTVVAVSPVSSDRTAEPMLAAVRPYCEAACWLIVTSTWGTCSDTELTTSTASSNWEISRSRSSAIAVRMR